MDQMLPSPGFSIPSIGTPMHQQDEDQQIMTNHAYPPFGSQHMAPPLQPHQQLQHQHQQQIHHQQPHQPMQSHPVKYEMDSGMSGVGGNSTGNNSGSSGLPSLMQTPTKMMQQQQQQHLQQTPNSSTFQPSYAAPHSLMQPQTPQSLMSPMVPMTDRTPATTDNAGANTCSTPSGGIGSVNVHQMMGPATPMTPMTPGSADPGILPQLQ